MGIAVPCENLLQHELDGHVLLEGQTGEVDLEFQLTAWLSGPKCSDGYSSQLGG